MDESLNVRLTHKQPEIWFQAFKLARRLYVLLAASCLFNCLLVLLAVILTVALTGRPADVVFVDKTGQATFIPAQASSEPAQDYEAIHFAETFTRDFLSLDTISAKEDLARALSVVHPKLQITLRNQLFDSGALERIRENFLRSTVKSTDVQIAEKTKDRFLIKITGSRTLTALGQTQQSASEPFHLELVLSPTKRSQITPNGLIVRYVSGSFGAHAIEGGDK